MNGFFQEGDTLHSVWGSEHNGYQAGATVGYDGVTKVEVQKADGPMGYYAVAVTYRGESIWQVLPLHMMSEIVVSKAEAREDTQ